MQNDKPKLRTNTKKYRIGVLRDQLMLSRPYFCGNCRRPLWLPARKCFSCGKNLPYPKVVCRGDEAWIVWGSHERRAMRWAMYVRLGRLGMLTKGWMLPYLDRLLGVTEIRPMDFPEAE